MNGDQLPVPGERAGETADTGLAPVAAENPGQGSRRGSDMPPGAEVALPARRQHPAGVVIGAVRQLRGLALPIIFLILTGGARGSSTQTIMVAVLGFGSVLWEAIGWWNLRYGIEHGQLEVTSGVLSRTERIAPLARIQSVDTTASPLQRLFGVVGLRIETAGGGKDTSIRLDAVSAHDAEHLRSLLLAGSQEYRRASAQASAAGSIDRASTVDDASEHPAPTTGPAPAAFRNGTDASTVVRRLSTRDLLIAGLTAGRIGPALALVAVGFRLLTEVSGEDRWFGWVRATEEGIAGGGVLVWFALILLVALIAWLLAVGGAVLTWGGFTVRQEDSRITIEHGLLDRRRQSVPVHRLQAITIEEGALRRPFGLAAVRFESAANGADPGEAGVLFPLLPRAEVRPFLLAIAPGFAPPAELPRFDQPPPRALGRFVTFDILLIALVAAVVTLLARMTGWIPWGWGSLMLVFAPVAALNGYQAFRHTGWAFDGDRLLARSGGLGLKLSIVPTRRVQYWQTGQDRLARRSRLTSIRFAVASGRQGGVIELPNLDETSALRLRDRLRPLGAAPAPVSATRPT